MASTVADLIVATLRASGVQRVYGLYDANRSRVPVLDIALRAAVQRRGVAVLVIPGDEALAAAAEVLNASRRVTILGGAGCAGAHQQLIELAGALQAPVLHAFRGKDAIE
jgi:thiamine pyrophosphate-dependent acetolactate synthase large subunit-like protein